MKIKTIYSDKILKGLSWFFPIAGITLFPFIILREFYQKPILEKKRKTIVRHEMIHIEQQRELLVIPFFILYGLFYLVNLIRYRDLDKAYMEIPFEREAYTFEDVEEYTKIRKKYHWTSFL